MKMNTPRFILLLLIVFSCKQEKGEITVDKLPGAQKTETLIQHTHNNKHNNKKNRSSLGKAGSKFKV